MENNKLLIELYTEILNVLKTSKDRLVVGNGICAVVYGLVDEDLFSTKEAILLLQHLEHQNPRDNPAYKKFRESSIYMGKGYWWKKMSLTPNGSGRKIRIKFIEEVISNLTKEENA